MTLKCPQCGSNNIVYAGTSTESLGGYRATDGRYTCKDCDYTGPLILEEEEEDKLIHYEEEEKYLKLPLFWVFILGIICLIAVALGEEIEVAAAIFLFFSFILGLFFYIIGEEHLPVEEDLEKLDEKGEPES